MMKFFETLTRRLRHCAPGAMPVATVLLILWLTLAPQPVGEIDIPLFPGIDKVVHACMFGFLTLISWFDCGRRKNQWRFLPIRTTALIATASLGFGIIIELLQLGMGLGRSFEWADIDADAAGCLLAFFLTAGLTPRSR